MIVSSWKHSTISRFTTYLAGSASRVRQLEQRLEALLAAEPLRGVRGLLPTARRAEPNRPSGPVLRQHCGARPCLGSRGKRGQENQALGRSRGGFSTKIHLNTDLEGNPLDFHLTGGEVSDTTQFETSLDPRRESRRPLLLSGRRGHDEKA